eukprot:scaffold1585_cov52-Attheya_sp.AAC.2
MACGSHVKDGELWLHSRPTIGRRKNIMEFAILLGVASLSQCTMALVVVTPASRCKFEISRQLSSAPITSMNSDSWSRRRPLTRQYTASINTLDIDVNEETVNGKQGNNADVEKLLHDLGGIAEIRPTDESSPLHLVSDESTYTALWSHADWNQHTSRALSRYARHVSNWPKSQTAHSILPMVLVFSIWSMVLSVASRRFQSVAFFVATLKIMSGMMGSILAPLVLLLTLRTNQSLARLMAARSALGRVVVSARSAASVITHYALNNNLDESTTSSNNSQRSSTLLAARYLAIFGWSIKAMLREGEDDMDILQHVLPPEEVAWVLRQPKRPLAILSRIRQLSCQGLGKDAESASGLFWMEKHLNDLNECVGICEGIFNSPIPPTYTRHTSRVLCLWLSFLPMSLIGTGLPDLAMILAVALTSCK